MRKEEFDVVLERDNERWNGQLLLQVDGNGVSGCITVDNHQSFFRGKPLRKDRYIVSLHLQISAWIEDCDALLVTKEDGTLTGMLVSPWQSWKLSGVNVRSVSRNFGT